MKNNREAVNSRHQRIHQIIQQRGEVKVEELAETFGVSLMTVRRDLKYLEDEKLILRTHGGAISPARAQMRLSQDERVRLCRDSISEYAARFIEDGDRVFINGSCTALNTLRYVNNKKVSVYTNNCHAFGVQYPEGVKLHFTGGEIHENVMVGEYVMKNILSMTADKTLIGCTAVYEDGEFSYNIPTEIGINEAMIARTDGEIYVLADHTKIKMRESKSSVYGSCTYTGNCTLITDSNASPTVLDEIRLHGINVIVVPAKAGTISEV